MDSMHYGSGSTSDDGAASTPHQAGKGDDFPSDLPRCGVIEAVGKMRPISLGDQPPCDRSSLPGRCDLRRR